MMYEEFMEKSGATVDRDTYEVIEYVYTHAPYSLVGKDATAFCMWFNTVTYKTIYDLADLLKKVDPMYGAEKDNEIDHLKTIVADLEAKLNVYETLFTESEIRDRLLSGLSTTDLMKAFAKKGVQ